MSYCSIHNHTALGSNCRFTDSMNRVEDLINKAIEYNFSGIAITDHEAITAHIDALNYYDKVKEEHPDFKLILGNEAYVIKKEEYKNAEKYFHFILLAKDTEGHKQLRILSSRAWERSYVENGQRRCPTFYEDLEEVVGENPGHLIASTACLGGYLPTKIQQRNIEAVSWFLDWGERVFGHGNFFLELQDSDSEEQKEVNQYLIKFSKQTDIPFIITQDAHYLNKEDYPIFEKFLTAKQTKEREVFSFYQYTYVKPESEIKRILSYLSPEDVQKGIDNTQLIYNQIGEYNIRKSTIVPECHVPEFEIEGLLKDWYEKYPAIKFYATESEFIQDKYLIYLIEQGIKEKSYQIGEVEADRINTELDVLKHISDKLGQRLSAYLNLVKTMTDIKWKVSFVGIARGSAMCFFINYLIGITQMNPLLYGIPYWRFLNKERVELPDIDEDSDPNKTQEILKLYKEYFGDKRVLNCLTYKKESLKSAIQTSGRGLGLLPEETQALSALVPVKRGQSYTLKDCLEGNEEKDYEPFPQLIEALKKYDGLYEAVQKIEGLPNSVGVHASALYVFNEDYENQVAMMRTSSGIPITCYDYHASDQCGCLKVDELRTDAMTKLMKTMELLLKFGQIQWQGSLRATYNKYLHPDVLEYNNSKMWNDMADGKISQLFQFETQVGGQTIKRLRPKTVQELSDANSVMRLMPHGNEEAPLDRYDRFKKNIQEWYEEMDRAGITKEEQEILKRNFSESYGCSIDQETMMTFVQDPDIADFSLGEANALRKGVAKKSSKIIAQMKERFFKGAT